MTAAACKQGIVNSNSGSRGESLGSGKLALESSKARRVRSMRMSNLKQILLLRVLGGSNAAFDLSVCFGDQGSALPAPAQFFCKKNLLPQPDPGGMTLTFR